MLGTGSRMMLGRWSSSVESTVRSEIERGWVLVLRNVIQ